MQNQNHVKNMIQLAAKALGEQKEYVDSYVAFIDILGFKNIVREKTAQEIKLIYDEIRMVDALFCGTDLPTSVPNEVSENLKMTILSDSIIISISKNIDSAFFGLFVFCLFIQFKLIGLKTPILTRGAISDGDYFRSCDKDTDTTIIFGPSLVDAILLQEEVAIYPRIVIRDALLSSEKTKLSGDNYAIINTFTRKSEDGYWFIDYLKFRMMFSKRSNAIKEYIESQLIEQQVDRVRQKYQWLEEYYNDTSKTPSGVI